MSSHICCECVCCYQDLAAAASNFLPLSVIYALIWKCMKMLGGMWHEIAGCSSYKQQHN